MQVVNKDFVLIIIFSSPLFTCNTKIKSTQKSERIGQRILGSSNEVFEQRTATECEHLHCWIVKVDQISKQIVRITMKHTAVQIWRH